MRHHSLAKKLPALVLSVGVLFGLLSWLLLEHHSDNLANNALQFKSTATLDRLLDKVPSAALNNDTISIQVALQKATEDPLIHSASFFDQSDQLKAQSARSDRSPSELAIFSRPIEVRETPGGRVEITVDRGLIIATHQRSTLYWLLLWVLFTGLVTYGCYRYSEQLSRRIAVLVNRLPGNSATLGDEINALEKRLEPLLALSLEGDNESSNGYFCTLVSAKLINRQRLSAQLNRDNLERLFETLDYCTLRTLELYGGHRIEGAEGTINFYIRSTECSKQHLLICLMAVYSLQQLLERLSDQRGIDLEIAWTLCSDNVAMVPIFSYHEQMGRLKQQSIQLAEKLHDGMIVLHTTLYDGDQLSTIARFVTYDKDCYALQAFTEERQLLLEKQIQHLANICLYEPNAETAPLT